MQNTFTKKHSKFEEPKKWMTKKWKSNTFVISHCVISSIKMVTFFSYIVIYFYLAAAAAASLVTLFLISGYTVCSLPTFCFFYIYYWKSINAALHKRTHFYTFVDWGSFGFITLGVYVFLLQHTSNIIYYFSFIGQRC